MCEGARGSNSHYQYRIKKSEDFKNNENPTDNLQNFNFYIPQIHSSSKID
jgi:hypothetical protein